ncbi:hypothetical protein [Alkalihalobacterium bogoriense]|nr:hypothetical protein [Alkalihalobacterium bogoriense]
MDNTANKSGKTGSTENSKYTNSDSAPNEGHVSVKRERAKTFKNKK